MRYASILLASLLLLTACAGEMQGVVRATGERVQFQYEQGIDSDQITAVVGGETFSGRAVMKDSSATFGTGFGTTFGGGNVFSSSGQVFSQSTTGNFVAVLLGNNGSTMQCELKYASAFGETSAGGVGQCQHSNRQIIDVVW